MIRRPPRSTLVPDATLFRSTAFDTCEPGPVLHAALNCGVERARAPVVLLLRDDMAAAADELRSEEHTSELQSRQYLACRLLLEKKKAPRPPIHDTAYPVTFR